MSGTPSMEGMSAGRALEARLVRSFCRSGYSELVVPYLEDWDTLELASDPKLRQCAVKVLDPQGGVKVLRPDFTASVSRIVAREMSGAPRPLRLFYSGTVFRRADPRNLEPEEFGQAGVEFIGGEAGCGPGRADLECVSLAVRSLVEAGLDGFTLVASHADLVPALFRTCGVPPDRSKLLRAILARHDLVQLHGAMKDELARRKGSLEPALAFLKTRVSMDQLDAGKRAVEDLRPTVARPEGCGALIGAIEDLESVLREVRRSHPRIEIVVDMSLVRELEYYTGMVFDVCAEGLGRPLGGGGRYDGLMEKFGRREPARGFAFRLDRLAEALGRRGRFGGGVRSSCSP